LFLSGAAASATKMKDFSVFVFDFSDFVFDFSVFVLSGAAARETRVKLQRSTRRSPLS
jgi:hypothetical protein